MAILEIDLKLCDEYDELKKLSDNELRIISKKTYRGNFTYNARMAQNILWHRWEENHYPNNEKNYYNDIDDTDEIY